MMSSATFLAALAALTAVTHGASLESNPIMVENPELPLDHQHPALGMQLAENEATYKTDVVLNAEAASPASVRRLEATSHDLRALERHFGRSMIVNPAQLPTKATYKPVPWPGSYWPTYQDGINVRWDGSQPSAAEKYAKAFQLNPKSFMDALSRNNGILAHSSRRPCTQDSQCSDLNDGSTCAKRDGESAGHCIPTWFGLCHSWAPAAIAEPEPRCPVVKNGVTFQLNDIKALITQLYDGARVPTVFLGARYNGPDSGAGVLDQYGRFTNAAARDLGPGFLHIAMSNMLGLLNTTFVADVTAGSQVWNQPIRGYEIVSSQPLSLADGAKRFFNAASYPFNAQAKSLLYVRNRVSYIVESNDNVALVSTGRVEYFTTKRDYEYVLELDAAGIIIGGEWVGNSKQNHFDFMWFSTRRAADNTVLPSGLSYKNVKDLLTASIQATC